MQFYGPVITPTLTTGLALTFNGLGTTSNLSYRWRRQGDRIFIEGCVQAGTLQAASLAILLPAGIRINLAKVIANRGIMGIGHGLWSATIYWTSGGWTLDAFSDGVNADTIYFSFKGNGTTSMATANGNDIMTGLGYFTFKLDFPVA